MMKVSSALFCAEDEELLPAYSSGQSTSQVAPGAIDGKGGKLAAHSGTKRK
jgi:hypothetical protein